MLRLKDQLRKRQPTLGTWITIPHPSIAEIMAKAGFDWVVVDMEHGAIDVSQAIELIRTIDLAGAAPLVRLYGNDATLIKRVMDAGSHGIVVPMVNCVEDAQAAVAATQYAPMGIRGVGLARAQGYGARFQEYVEWLRTEAVVIVQVEHIQAVNNMREILAVPGVDGFILGPYDLSASLGVPGQFSHPKMVDALAQVRAFVEQSSTVAGVHVVEPSMEEVLARFREGYRFVAFSLDFRMLDVQARSAVAKTQDLLRSLHR